MSLSRLALPDGRASDTEGFRQLGLRPFISSTASSPSHFVSHLLKALPLIRSQDLLQALVGLLANVVDARL
jgi:hypothetical protein